MFLMYWQITVVDGNLEIAQDLYSSFLQGIYKGLYHGPFYFSKDAVTVSLMPVQNW